MFQTQRSYGLIGQSITNLEIKFKLKRNVAVTVMVTVAVRAVAQLALYGCASKC